MDAATRSRRAKLSILVAFAVFLAIGGLGIVVNLPDVLTPLSGVETQPPRVAWDWQKFRQGPAQAGSPQHQIETQVKARFGWRTFLVRLDHQVSWSLFGETPPLPIVNGIPEGTRVIYGVHEWLFEEHYIHHAVLPPVTPEKELRARVDLMKRVQEKLAARGLPFLLLVAPNKAEIFPEKIPPYLWQGRDRLQVTTNFERTRPLLDEAGVRWIDGPTLYARWKAEGKRHLYARSGTHWSYHSVVDVIAELRRELNATMRRPMPELVVRGTTLAAPQINDRDLIDLANLLVSAPYEHSVPFPRIEPQTAVPADQLPRIAWVHDSFGWPLIELIYRGQVAAPGESFYYYNLFPNPRRVPGAAELPYAIANLDWPAYLAERDAVVMVWTEIAVDFWGWGFLEKIDAALP